MRSIDLTTNVLAPVVVGQILTFASPFAGTVFIGTWNILSLVIEYYLLNLIYANVPELSQKEVPVDAVEDVRPLWNIWVTFDAWKLYFHHSIRYAGMGLALLYMTVMGFDSITFGIYSFNDN